MAASPRALAQFLLFLIPLLTTGCGSSMQAFLPPAQAVQPATPAPELTFTAAPVSAEAGQTVTLTWTTRYADKVTISPNLGEFAPQGTHSFVAQDSVTLSATAIGPGGVTTTDFPLAVTRPKRPPRHLPEFNPINHIVIMFQENRSFDNYFSNLNVYRVANGLPADVDVASPTATNPTFEQDGNTISRFHLLTVCHENTSPAWNESHVQIDTDYLIKLGNTVTQSRMNGFVYTGAKYARDQVPMYHDTSGTRAMGYYTEADLPYYYFMATNFAISDRWFAPVPANSKPNRLFTIAATSNGYIYEPQITGGIKSIFHLLEEKGVSWKVYYSDSDANGPIAYIRYFDTFYQANKSKVVPVSQYFTDLQSGTLPQVAMIESGLITGRDEHPGSNVQIGSAYAASFINALMNSSAWGDSVFFLSYDEPGGVYDHVPPPAAPHPDGIAPVDKPPSDIQGDFNRYGARVPNIVISPFSKPGYVSHTVLDSTAILKFIQTRFDLPSLTARDSAQPNMYEFFNFSAPPRLTPPTPPVQPTNGACYYDRLP